MLGSLLSLRRSLSETSDSEPSEPEWLLESSLPEVELLVERDSDADSLMGAPHHRRTKPFDVASD